MPVCSVIGCGIRKTPNQPSLTIHRIPRNEHKKKMWLEAIAMENIKRNVKDIYICSLHFDDKCFNRTLDVTRLRDDAVPSKFVRQHASQHKTGILKENQLETNPVLKGSDTSTLVPLKDTNTSTHTAPHAGISGIATFIPCKKAASTVSTPAHGTSDVGIPKLRLKTDLALNSAPALLSGTSAAVTSALPKTTIAACTASFVSIPGTSGVDNLPNQAQKIKKLEDKCDFLRKKVKKLNQIVRRQKKKIAEFRNIMGKAKRA